MLYTKIDAMSDQYTYDLDVSYVEIYNENIKDLLSPGLGCGSCLFLPYHVLISIITLSDVQ